MLGALASCGKQNENDAETVPESETTAQAEAAEVILTEGKTPKFKLIRSEEATDAAVDVVIEFRKQLEEMTGIRFDFGTDWTKKGTEVDETTPEILVGLTNRSASASAAEGMNALQYKIDVQGNKIVILGSNHVSLKAAVEHVFKNSMITLNADGNFVLSGYPVSGEATFSDNEVPPYLYGNVEFFESSGGTYVMKATGTSADQYKEYFYYDAMSSDILAAKAHKRVGSKGTNNGADNIITNGSAIAVNEGQCALIVADGKVVEVSIKIFDDNCYAFQPFYKLSKATSSAWVGKVVEFIHKGEDKCYAENAMNEIFPALNVRAFDYNGYYVDEIDNLDDWTRVKEEILPFDEADAKIFA